MKEYKNKNIKELKKIKEYYFILIEHYLEDIQKFAEEIKKINMLIEMKGTLL